MSNDEIFVVRCLFRSLKVAATPKNDSLIDFGFTEKDLSSARFTETGSIVSFGVEPVRVDMINSISGVAFEEAWANKIRGTYGKTEVSFIGRAELIANKSSTGRIQDQADCRKLTGE